MEATKEKKAIKNFDENISINSIILNTAKKLAENLSSSAIIISGDIIYDDISTNIPIYINTNSHNDLIDQLALSSIYKTNKTLSDKLINQSYHRLGEIEYVAALEFILGNLDSNANIVAIVGNIESCAIVLHYIKENKILNKIRECEERIKPDVLKAILNICIEISVQGREGKKIGTSFIIGDVEEVMQRSHALIINPYLGQNDEDSNILETHNWESVLELSQLDGVFVVSEEGKIHAAGRYLNVDARDIVIDKGLGGRHVSAAAITRDTVSIAITVSESGGVIRIYKDGKELFCFSTINRCIKL